MSDVIKRVARECVGFRVRKLNRIVSALYDGVLAGAGLKTTQFSLLVATHNMGSARPTELAKFLEMDQSTLSRNVERMCAKGWLRLLPEGEDRRSHVIETTEKGRALLSKAYPAWQRAQEEISRRLGTEDVAALNSILRKLSA
jgi:DNA-binding MarR family transcriptional regulator